MISAISKVLSKSQQHRLVSLSCDITRNISFPEGGFKYSVVYSSVGRFGPSSPSKVHPNSDTAYSRLQMDLPGKQPHVPMPISKCLPNTKWLKPKTSSTAAQRFCCVEEASFPHRITRIHGGFSRVQCRWGDDVDLPCLRTLAGAGQSGLNPHDPSLLWTGLVLELFLSLAFLFMPQGFSHWSAVPGHSYHPGVVLLGQRIRTRKERNGPASQVILRIHETPHSKSISFVRTSLVVQW